MLQPLALRISDEVRVLGSGAYRASVFGRDAVGLLDAHEHERVDATPDYRARFFVERGDFFPALHFVNTDVRIDIFLVLPFARFCVGVLAFLLAATTPEAAVARHTVAGY